MIKTFESKIQGMICRQCEDAVCNTLLCKRGIIEAKASFVKNTVFVKYDADLISEDEISSSLKNTGYPLGKKNVKEYLIELLILCIVLGAFFVFKNLKHINIPVLGSGASFGIVFLTGLLTGAHCISMCGGIELSQVSENLDMNERKSRKVSVKSLMGYNIGRVITSTILGACFGGMGQAIAYSIKAKSIVFTMVGLVMIFIGVRMWGIIPGLRKLEVFVPKFCDLPKQVKKASVGKPVLVGLLTGIMPCGASYAMWLFSATTGSAIKGALTMLVWGIGTVPLLFAFGIIGTVLPQKYSKWMIIVNVILIIAFGVSMSMKGIGML